MIYFKEIFHEVLQLRGDLWIPFLLGSVAVMFSTFILALRYKFILGFLNEKIHLFDSFNIACSTQFISYISPFRMGSVVTKPLITKAISSVTFKKSALASVFEQLYEITWQIILLPILIYFVGKKYLYGISFFHLVIIVILLVGLILILINSEKIIEILWKVNFLAPRFVRDFSKKKNLSKRRILDLIERSKFYLRNKKMFIVVTIITFIFFILSALALEVFLVYFGYDIPYSIVLAAFWISAIMGRLSGLPLGLGVRDVSLGAILVASGVALVDSVKMVILIRLTITITLTLLGVLFLVYNSKRIKDFGNILRKRESLKKK